MPVILPIIPALMLAVGFQTAPPPAASAAAAIHGRVVDRESGAPVARVTVVLACLCPGAQKRQAVTGNDGDYAFQDLRPGSYSLHAEPAEDQGIYLSQRYNHSENVDPVRTSIHTSAITLSAGDRQTAHFALAKALSIEGRVIGEHGQPVAGARMILETPDGSGVAVRGGVVRTDERGAFTLTGVRPGNYRICADPGTNFTLMRTPGRYEGEHPVRTCYSAVSPAGRGIVSLTTAGVSGVEIVMRRSLHYSVSGTVIDSSGAPLSNDLFMLTESDLVSRPSSMDVRHVNGRFTARGLPPGEYVIRARTGRFGQPPPSDVEVASLRFTVTDADVEDLVVQTKKAMSVAGRVEFADGMPAERPIVNVNFVSRETDALSGNRPAVRVADDLTFRLDDVFGPVVLRVYGGMRPWVVKAITFRGEDVYGRTVDLRHATKPDDLVVVLTNRAAEVSGRVAPPAPGPLPNTLVFLVAFDRSRPGNHALATDTSAAVEKDGSYRLPRVRAGEYLLFAAAAGEIQPGLWQYASTVLERYLRTGQRIRLAEDEQRTIDLTLATPK